MLAMSNSACSSVPQPSSCTTPLGHKEGAQTNVGDGDRGSPSCLLSSGGGGDSTISNRSSMRIGFGGQGGQSLDEYHDPHPLTDIHRVSNKQLCYMYLIQLVASTQSRVDWLF